MKYFATIFLCLVSTELFAQNFSDDFSDGDFTNNPSWSGAEGNFVIFNLNGNNVLRLNDNEASSSYLSTPTTNITGEWEFFVKIDGSAPSNGNKAEIFLMSDIADLSGPVNGYAVRIGETGDDVFKIIRLDAGSQSTVLEDTTIFKAGGEYRVNVSRDGSGNWGIEVGEGYNGELKNSGNTANDNTYTSSGFFGVLVTYTATRTDDFYFDFKIDEPQVVVDPVLVESFTQFNETEIDLDFSRDIDFGSVSTTDFVLNETTNPLSFSNQGSKALRITFESSLPGGENNLMISDIESATNDTVLTDTTITFFVFDAFEEGDIIINEFLKDPPAGSGLSEYVELRNTSLKYLNLKGWEVGDNNTLTTIAEEDMVLLPDSFLVVTSNPAALIATFGEGIYVDVSLPALNNTTDQIRLFNGSSELVDSLEYTPDWGGVDVALERRSPVTASTILANWGDSPLEIGTPGRTNDIEPDTEAPFIISAQIPDSNTVILLSSETLTESSALNTDNYVISPQNMISEIVLNADTIKLGLNQSLSDGDKLIIQILNQRDVFGNINESQTVEVVYFEIAIAMNNEVVINEILYRREDELSPEFVELFNPTNKNFDLSGWELIDAGSNTGDIPEGTFLPAGEYLVLTDRESFANSLSNGIYLPDFPSLNDSGDDVVIKNSEGITIDSLFYQSDWGGDIPGVSLERKDPEAASNDASNWSTSTAQTGFSAGIQSSVFEEDISPPEIIFAAQAGQTVEIIFSEFISISGATIFNVNGTDADLLEWSENRAIVEWSPVPDAVVKSSGTSSSINITVLNISDVKGNTAPEISSPIASPITSGNIIINEIMYDPLADSEDNLPDQTEYIELYNRSNSAVSLEGIFLHDAPDEESEVRTIEPVSSQYKWIQPGGYFLIYAEDEASVFAESKTARYFGMENESDQFTIRVDRSNLSLASTGDAIYLADSTGATIDSVFYEESWQNPNVFDTDGIALERINPDGPSNSESNWSSSTHVSGGTPNNQNTIFQEPGAVPESVGISFSPNPFSPDDDGFEDNLFINYTLDAPDYLLRVRIFDRYGREVRELANNQQAGFEGSLIWDGLTDDRRKNRVGIYIVLFEAYNSANGTDRTFKETVVLARMF